MEVCACREVENAVVAVETPSHFDTVVFLFLSSFDINFDIEERISPQTSSTLPLSVVIGLHTIQSTKAITEESQLCTFICEFMETSGGSYKECMRRDTSLRELAAASSYRS